VEDSDEEPPDEAGAASDYLTPFLPPGSGAGALSREQCLGVREGCLRALKDRLVERARLFQVWGGGWWGERGRALQPLLLPRRPACPAAANQGLGCIQRLRPAPPLTHPSPQARLNAERDGLARRQAAFARDRDVLSHGEAEEHARAVEEAGFKIDILEVGRQSWGGYLGGAGRF
jgi:hypothetical protein